MAEWVAVARSVDRRDLERGGGGSKSARGCWFLDTRRQNTKKGGLFAKGSQLMGVYRGNEKRFCYLVGVNDGLMAIKHSG